jgi:hypothetical protein
MTTNKQALREKFEAWWEVNYHNGNPPRFGWEHWRDGDGYKIDDDESELDGMWESWQAAHSSKLEAAEKRIAELEARTVTLPTPYPKGYGMVADKYNFALEECSDAICAAGISITTKGE